MTLNDATLLGIIAAWAVALYAANALPSRDEWRGIRERTAAWLRRVTARDNGQVTTRLPDAFWRRMGVTK